MHYIPLHQLMSTKDRTRLRRNLYVNRVINDIKQGSVEDDPFVSNCLVEIRSHQLDLNSLTGQLV